MSRCARWELRRWQLRKAHPNISFPAEPTPEDLAPFNVFPVTINPQPDGYNRRLQTVEQLPPTSTADGWVIDWALRNTTPEEQASYDAAHTPCALAGVHRLKETTGYL
jgi:hypothetical protein